MHTWLRRLITIVVIVNVVSVVSAQEKVSNYKPSTASKFVIVANGWVKDISQDRLAKELTEELDGLASKITVSNTLETEDSESVQLVGNGSQLEALYRRPHGETILRAIRIEAHEDRVKKIRWLVGNLVRNQDEEFAAEIPPDPNSTTSIRKDKPHALKKLTLVDPGWFVAGLGVGEVSSSSVGAQVGVEYGYRFGNIAVLSGFRIGTLSFRTAFRSIENVTNPSTTVGTAAGTLTRLSIPFLIEYRHLMEKIFIDVDIGPTVEISQTSVVAESSQSFVDVRNDASIGASAQVKFGIQLNENMYALLGMGAHVDGFFGYKDLRTVTERAGTDPSFQESWAKGPPVFHIQALAGLGWQLH